MNILCTGGAGFIGSVLVETLLDSGHKVTVLDNFQHGENSLGHLCHWKTLSIVRGDAFHVGLVKVRDFDVVIPLAAVVGATACDADPTKAERTNEHAIQMLCLSMSNEQALIIPITNSGYGIGEPGQPCTEDSPLNPLSHYGRTKVAAEKYAMARENSISLRLATVFGMSARMRMDLLVNDLVWRAMRDRSVVIFEGHFVRNYIHVADVAQAFVHAINNFDAMKGNVYNVGLSDANLTKLELCARIKAQLPDFTYLEAPIGEDPDQRNYIVSNDKLEATGWNPSVSLDDGISELIKGYVSLNPMRYRNA